MSFKNQNILVVGATGVVGSGVVRKYLDAGANVWGVSRSAGNLANLRKTMDIKDSDPFVGVVGDFSDEAGAKAAKAAVLQAMHGKQLHHVVTVQGFITPGNAPTESTVESLNTALTDGLINNFLAAKMFLPSLKDRDTSFTLVSGGLAHMAPPDPSLWLGTVKNAALNALTFALASETAKDKVRVNTLCIHFGVAPAGQHKNQRGLPAEGDTLRLAPAFLALARGAQKGQLLCLHAFSDADRLAKG